MHYDLTTILTSESTIARFWKYVSKSERGCWEWTGYRDNMGYGRLSFKGKPIRVHRIAYLLAHGELPLNAVIMHVVCDNPACVRPDHLCAGTQADNLRDMFCKGRDRHNPRCGEDNSRARLTQQDVESIRQRYAVGGISQKELGREYGMRQPEIGGIVRGRCWKQAGGPITPAQDPRGENNRRAVLTETQVRQIRQRCAEGVRRNKLASEYGISPCTVGAIVNHRIWKHVT